MLPVETSGVVGHLIVLQTVYSERSWPDVFATRLRLLGEMLVGALQRQTMVDGLREAEERVSLAADSAEAGLWTLDYDTGVFWVTPRTRGIFGFTPDEVIDMARLEASVHPQDWEIVRGGIERATRERAPVDVEYRIIVPGDTHARWIAARGQPHYAPSGEPGRLMGHCIDVSARKQAEEEHRRSETRLESGADLAGVAFYEVDFTEGVAFVDDRFRTICGMPPELAQGLQPVEFWLEHIHAEDRARVMDQRTRLHDGTLERIDIEYRFLNPAHGERWIHHLARVGERDAAGHSVRSFGVIRDITARRRAGAQPRHPLRPDAEARHPHARVEDAGLVSRGCRATQGAIGRPALVRIDSDPDPLRQGGRLPTWRHREEDAEGIARH